MTTVRPAGVVYPACQGGLFPGPIFCPHNLSASAGNICSLAGSVRRHFSLRLSTGVSHLRFYCCSRPSTSPAGASLSISAAASGYGSYSIDFSAGDDVQFYCDGTSINRPFITAFFKRR